MGKSICVQKDKSSRKILGNKVLVTIFITALFAGWGAAMALAPARATTPSETPYITVLSPNGGETLVAGKIYPIKWLSSGIERVRIYTCQYYNLDGEVGRNCLVISGLDGSESGVDASSGVYQWYIDPAATYVPSSIDIRMVDSKTVNWAEPNVYDDSDALFSIVASNTPVVVSEQVKCVFNNGVGEQKCYTATDSTSPYYNQGCSIQADQIACIVDLKGNAGDKITWKSSCGGAAYLIMDGVRE